MRSPSHSAVLNDWNFAGGLPGSTARIEAGQSESGRSLRVEPRYTIARVKGKEVQDISMRYWALLREGKWTRLSIVVVCECLG